MRILISILFIFITTTVYATDYYVKNGGDDNNTGLSDSQAWETISKVNSFSFSPGDNVYFKKDNSWIENIIFPSSGSANNIINISSYGVGQNPIVLGINIEDKSYITISNIESQTSLTTVKRALTIKGSHDIIVYNCKFDGKEIDNDSTQKVVKIVKSNSNLSYDITIKDTTVCNGGSMATYPEFGGGLCLENGTHDIVIKNCIIYNHVEVCTQAYSDDVSFPVYNITWSGNNIYNEDGYNNNTNIRGINVGFNTYNCTIKNNYILDCSKFMISSDAGSHDTIIRNNVLCSVNIPTVQGMVLILANGSGDNTNTFVYNNTIVSVVGSNYGIFISTSSGANSSGHIIKNNIVYSNQTDFNLIRVQDTTSTFVSNYNCFYNSGGGNIFYYGGDYASFADYKTVSGQDTNSIDTNPNLTDNYSIVTGSSCENTGETLSEVKTDFRGLTRPQGSAYDIGAYETGSVTEYTGVTLE